MRRRTRRHGRTAARRRDRHRGVRHRARFGADAVAYSLGFVIATGCLHLIGIAFGLLARWPAGRLAVRTAGGAIAMAGLMFLGRLA
jgi:hydrogenase/urease accessory protein HupE